MLWKGLTCAMSFLVGLVLLFAGCAPMVAEPPPGAFKADVGYPPPGTKFVTRTADHTGQTRTTTFTVLEEGTYEGKPVYRVSDGVDISIRDKATRSWIATLREGKERFAASPSSQDFSPPLWVGKSWAAGFTYYDRERGRSFSNVTYWWKVEAYEDVKVSAGTFKAFRLDGSNPFSSTTVWYAPELKLVVKQVYERNSNHYLGYGKSTTELTEYPAKQ